MHTRPDHRLGNSCVLIWHTVLTAINRKSEERIESVLKFIEATLFAENR